METALPTWQRVLVPMDFSATARLALKTALREANKPEGVVILFYVPGLYERKAEDNLALLNPFRVNIPEAYGQQFLAWARDENTAGVHVEALPQMGMPDAGVIATMARLTRSSLIVVGKREYSFWERLVRECPIETLPRVASCRVQVVGIEVSAQQAQSRLGEPGKRNAMNS